jgi:hypothetical protein
MDEYWFKQKTHGYGAGLPTCWQGWALLAGFLVGLAVSTLPVFILRNGVGVALHLVALTVLLVPFLLICRAKTEGGWRWRWGRNS